MTWKKYRQGRRQGINIRFSENNQVFQEQNSNRLSGRLGRAELFASD